MRTCPFSLRLPVKRLWMHFISSGFSPQPSMRNIYLFGCLFICSGLCVLSWKTGKCVCGCVYVCMCVLVCIENSANSHLPCLKLLLKFVCMCVSLCESKYMQGPRHRKRALDRKPRARVLNPAVNSPGSGCCRSRVCFKLLSHGSTPLLVFMRQGPSLFQIQVGCLLRKSQWLFYLPLLFWKSCSSGFCKVCKCGTLISFFIPNSLGSQSKFITEGAVSPALLIPFNHLSTGGGGTVNDL